MVKLGGQGLGLELLGAQTIRVSAELKNIASHPVGLLLVKCAWHFRPGGCGPGHMCLCARGM